MLVKGAYSKLLKPMIHKSYALGFQISKELIQDDLYLYGGIMRKPSKIKLKVKTILVVDGNFGQLKFKDGQFSTTGVIDTLSIQDAKDYIKAFKLLLKEAKTSPKKVVRRKRRIKK